MFYTGSHSATSEFNSDVSNWVTSRVKNMYGSKWICANTILSSSIHFLTRNNFTIFLFLLLLSIKITAFKVCTKFNSDLSKWDIARVTSMSWSKKFLQFYLFFLQSLYSFKSISNQSLFSSFLFFNLKYNF